VAVEFPAAGALKMIVPGPETLLQAPLPRLGVLPPRLLLVSEPQMDCATPTVAGATMA
jgi:hypothetical protein